MRLKPGALLLNAVLIAGALLTVAPLLWMLSASFMPTGQANSSPPPLLPSRVTFEHYRELFTHLSLARSFANSLLVSVVGTLATLVTSVASVPTTDTSRLFANDRARLRCVNSSR